MVLGACASAPPGVTPDPELLAFVREGATARAEVLLRLGEPSGVFESERILTYRIASNAGGGRWVAGRELLLGRPSGGYADRCESLVLVFDESGVLARHALVAVEP